jgi:hypothetical protein
MKQQAQLQVDGGDNSRITSSVGAQVVAGGKALQLVDQIVTVTACTMAIDTIVVVFAMCDMVPIVTWKAARILGLYGWMLNYKISTLRTHAVESAVTRKETTDRTDKEPWSCPMPKHVWWIRRILLYHHH